MSLWALVKVEIEPEATVEPDFNLLIVTSLVMIVSGFAGSTLRLAAKSTKTERNVVPKEIISWMGESIVKM